MKSSLLAPNHLAAVMRVRSHYFKFVRSFFGSRDFLEVSTPVLSRCPGVETNLGLFSTQWKNWDRIPQADLFLRTSPELSLKTLLAAGEPRVFEIAPCFRNHGEHSSLHHPEFTMLEFYQMPSTLQDLIHLTVDFIKESFSYFKYPSPLGPLLQFRVADLFDQLLGIPLTDNDPLLPRRAREKGVISIQDHDDFTSAFFKIMIDVVEPWLRDKPLVALTHYPASHPTLSVSHQGFSERFEIYCWGVELCNGYEELMDPASIKTRLEDSQLQRRQEGSLPGCHHNVISQFAFHAAGKNLPPACGNALGLDRLIMLARGCKDIHEILPYASDWLEPNILD